MKISVQWPIYLTATRLIKPDFPILRCLFGNPLNEFRKKKDTHFRHFYEIETEYILKKVNAATSGLNSLPKKLGWSY